jgi:hypothetical protein
MLILYLKHIYTKHTIYLTMLAVHKSIFRLITGGIASRNKQVSNFSHGQISSRAFNFSDFCSATLSDNMIALCDHQKAIGQYVKSLVR